MDDRRKLDLPDRRQNTYEELENKLESELGEHTRAVEKRLNGFFNKSLFIFAVIGITSAVALFGFSVTLTRIKDTRRSFVESSCVAQNKRHDTTIAKFREAAERSIKRTPEFADEIRASIKDNLEIIDALAPKQDCVRLGKVAVGDEKPPPPTIPTGRRNP
jgi:hypothetical protein